MITKAFMKLSKQILRIAKFDEANTNLYIFFPP